MSPWIQKGQFFYKQQKSVRLQLFCRAPSIRWKDSEDQNVMKVDEEGNSKKVEGNVQNVQRFNGQLRGLGFHSAPTFTIFFRDDSSFSNRCSCPNASHLLLFFLQKLTRGAISHRIIHHICTSASKFSIKSSPFLCSMSHSLIHHSRQGDWAAALVVNDHSESGSKHEETPTGPKRICAKCSPFLMVNYFVWPII